MQTRSKRRAAMAGKVKVDDDDVNNGNERDNLLEAKANGKKSGTQEENWRRDKWSILLLLLLYFLQGLPFGLSGTLDLTMQEGAKLSYEEQGIYSSVSWPYSLKMLWAPIIDAVFIKRIGRRKTWLIPTQLAIAFMLLFSADYIPDLMGENTSSKPQVWQLTCLFFAFFFLCATQDIAVDGWALEMLSKENIGWASTCNSVGLTAGYTVSFQGFMALKSFGACDFPQFMKLSGVGFLVATFFVAVFKKEAATEEAPESVKNAYLQTFQILRLAPVQMLMAALITRSVAFSATETLTTRKLLAMGMKKEMIATIAAILMPVSVILPGILTKHINDKPVDLFVKCYVPRMILAVCSVLLVMFCPTTLATEEAPFWFWSAVLVLAVLANIVTTAQFVALMAFFAKVSDPLVGGSYMTTLNTATNFGSKWPNTLVLFLVNRLTWKECDDSSCAVIIDGYYVLAAICLVIGVFWVKYFRNQLHRLETLHEGAWRVPRGIKKEQA